MKVWTAQSLEAYEKIVSGKGYTVWEKDEKDDKIFPRSYAWMRRKAIEHGLTDDGHGLIWFRYRWYDTRRKIDVRTLRKYADKGQKMVYLTLEVPDDKVLLVDTCQWECVLNDVPCFDSVEEFDAYDALSESEQEKFKETSWEKVFEPGSDGPIEGVFFGIDRSMIKAVQFYEGTRTDWGL